MSGDAPTRYRACFDIKRTQGHCNLRANQWQRTVEHHLIPELPGKWRAVTWVVHLEPVDWFVKAVIFSISHGRIKVAALVQFLAVPFPHWVANRSIPLGGYGRTWNEPKTFSDAHAILGDVAPLIRDEAIPFLEQNAGFDSHLAYLAERVRSLDEHIGGGGWQDVNVDEELTYVHMLRGDMTAAERTARWAERAGPNDGRAGALEASERVRHTIAAATQSPARGIAILRENAAQTRAALKLPPS